MTRRALFCALPSIAIAERKEPVIEPVKASVKVSDTEMVGELRLAAGFSAARGEKEISLLLSSLATYIHNGGRDLVVTPHDSEGDVSVLAFMTVPGEKQ